MTVELLIDKTPGGLPGWLVQVRCHGCKAGFLVRSHVDNQPIKDYPQAIKAFEELLNGLLKIEAGDV